MSKSIKRFRTWWLGMTPGQRWREASSIPWLMVLLAQIYGLVALVGSDLIDRAPALGSVVPRLPFNYALLAWLLVGTGFGLSVAALVLATPGPGEASKHPLDRTPIYLAILPLWLSAGAAVQALLPLLTFGRIVGWMLIVIGIIVCEVWPAMSGKTWVRSLVGDVIRKVAHTLIWYGALWLGLGGLWVTLHPDGKVMGPVLVALAILVVAAQQIYLWRKRHPQHDTRPSPTIGAPQTGHRVDEL